MTKTIGQHFFDTEAELYIQHKLGDKVARTHHRSHLEHCSLRVTARWPCRSGSQYTVRLRLRRCAGTSYTWTIPVGGKHSLRAQFDVALPILWEALGSDAGSSRPPDHKVVKATRTSQAVTVQKRDGREFCPSTPAAPAACSSQCGH